MITTVRPFYKREYKLYPQLKNVVKEQTEVKRHNTNLDALRGFCAIFVLIHHLMGYYNYLDPLYSPNYLQSLQPHGVLRVLIFFVLSGYVIGKSNKTPLIGKNVSSYLTKRLVRLYPIYAIGLVLALAVSTSSYSHGKIFGNFTFTQFLLTDIIEENSPIWSLQFEMIYLLLFIPISFFNIHPLLVAGLSILIGVVNYLIYPKYGSPVISSYAYGFVFWSVGLSIAKYSRSQAEQTVNYSFLLGIIPLILCLHKLNIFYFGFTNFYSWSHYNSLDFPEAINWHERSIRLVDLSFLPYCLMFILSFANVSFRFKKHLFGALLLFPVLSLILLFRTHKVSDSWKFLLLFLFYAAGLALCVIKSIQLNKLSARIIKTFSCLGGISYSLYIVHFPLLFLFKRYEGFSGTLITFVTRLFIYILLVFSLSYALDKKLQPWIKRKLLPH